MKRVVVSAAAAALLVAGCAAGVAVPDTRDPLPARPAPGPVPAANALESQMHDLVNRRRSGLGLPPLRWDARVAEIAREHSRAMASGRRPFSHDGFDERAEAIGQLTPTRSLAENVAYDSRTGADLAEQVVAGWISSSGHRQNIDGEST